MTAVLTGRLTIAKLLLRKGAAVDVKDKGGLRARDYSKARFFQEKLARYERPGLPAVSQEQRRERRLIAEILRYPAALRSRFVLFFPSSFSFPFFSFFLFCSFSLTFPACL